MSVSIVNCPQCKSLLLSDTAQCPNCHHVLHTHQDVNLSELKTHSQVMGSGSNEIACPDCGEMVRKELVRCYQCGAFLRKEMAESYQRMRENAPDVPTPRLREVSQAPRMIPSAAPATNPTDLPPLADDDDFSLGAGVTAVPASQSVATAASSNETYSLDAPPSSPSSAAAAELPDLPMDDAKSGTKKTAPSDSESMIPHSEATAGDLLLDIAKQEETESESRRKQRGKRKPGDLRTGFIIFCPWGHQIEVQEKHRGQMGKCPRCKAAFIVPLARADEKPAETTPSEAATTPASTEPAGALAAGKFTRWMKDVRIHPLDPTKLKLKPGSLESTFDTQDLGFGLDGLLLLTLSKKGGLFGGGDKKKPEVRDAAVAHLAAGKPLTELQVAAQRLFGPDTIKQIQVVQPVVYAHESMFAGIPVFGSHRIAVRLPKPAEGNELLFASFWLSEFREFAKQMDEVFGVQGMGEDVGVPMVDKVSEHKCHYTEMTFSALENVEYHQADPNIKLAIVGRKCEGCGLIVSEDGRKKEKLGGPDGKGIAKAKCPKCQKKFGSFAFYAVESAAVDPSATSSAPAAT
jgi:hypothetical protein